eukprot:jgi/Mesen1/6098/ME000031S05366
MQKAKEAVKNEVASVKGLVHHKEEAAKAEASKAGTYVKHPSEQPKLDEAKDEADMRKEAAKEERFAGETTPKAAQLRTNFES